MKVIIYSRCSTDELRQDTDVQLKELRRYATAFDWEIVDEVSEYSSAFKGEQLKLNKVIERIRKKHCDILLVYSLDRFSRQAARKTNFLLDTIVYDYKCRFIALKEGIDSQNEMTWSCIKPIFTYLANVYSVQLSDKIKAGIKNKKEKGKYTGGRPKKEYDLDRLKELYWQGFGMRKIATKYNVGLNKKYRISHMQVGRLLKNNTLINN